jgi:hypothetical protein
LPALYLNNRLKWRPVLLIDDMNVPIAKNNKKFIAECVKLHQEMSIFYLMSEYSTVYNFMTDNTQFKTIVDRFEPFKFLQYRRPFEDIAEGNEFLKESWKKMKTNKHQNPPAIKDQDLKAFNDALDYSAWHVRDVLKCLDVDNSFKNLRAILDARYYKEIQAPQQSSR